MNHVQLVGRLTRDPELHALASGKMVAKMCVVTDPDAGPGQVEYHAVIAWDRLASVCAQYLGKGQMVGVVGRLQTRQWDDTTGARHWRTEVVAASVEMLSGRAKRDFAADATGTATA